MHPYLQALAGGAMIGASASILWVFHGRIAGISGIVGELFTRKPDGVSWRVAFLTGLLTGGVALGWFAPERITTLPDTSPIWMVAAGLLVGAGTRIGNGCTSGHGVCGIPRGSRRSLTATLTFIGVGMLTVGVMRALGGLS
ncbi:MAG: YeeE/YedE family protein [Proteobacteria bacterium]|nr:YeeE/YedE family protein [Pseudomonadota bacterium]